MFVPDVYRAPGPGWAVDLLRGHPMAILTTSCESGEPLATHLPVILDESTLALGQGETQLEGVTLLGHMNRSNPHWTALAATSRALLIFQGPQGYVSPAWYDVVPAAPTWNFTSVHVHVEVTPLPPGEPTLAVVRSTARTLEARFGPGWDQSESVDYFRQIVGGVGAFSMTVTAAEGMFKLSQEKNEELRGRVVEALRTRGLAADHGLADIMSELGTS